ncbi:hypothetical protein K2173_000004 [Erythroxylum novogranatense]|uniref:non-specific serine/threonine protein kinase n=1 Tax=Erythroxylum novogranatense TaxID=1862640 RepID=A0AAV8SPB6_9ROSI|nr:hypothetical protein K2173_000004 [Erythroxylum novogranatense]
MDKHLSVSLLFCSCLVFSAIHVNFAANYVPTDKILLDCGASSDVTDSDGQKWVSDNGSKFLSASANSSMSEASNQDPDVPQVPYMTARVFQSKFTYSFPLASGRVFLRLYFYPSVYNGLNSSDGLFSVTAGSYTLLKNFSVYQTTQALDFAFIVKEYYINVNGGSLNVTFSPASDHPKDFAFVNGIEIVSLPDIYSNTDGSLMVVGQTGSFTIDNSTSLENVYRVNVAGNGISPPKDTGFLRTWGDDQLYLFGAAIGLSVSTDPNMTISYPINISTYVAPDTVYSSARTMGTDNYVNLNYNLTWIFSVDSGFFYLIRLHFCEIVENITKQNQRVFDIYLNNQIAETMDVVAMAGGNGVPLYRDYVVLVHGGKPQEDMRLDLHPNIAAKPQFYNAILNGVEIFKLSDADGNLAGPNPILAPKQNVIDPSRVKSQSSGHSSNGKAIVAGGISSVIVLALVVGFCYVALARRHRYGKEASASEGSFGWFPLSLYGNSHSAGWAKMTTTANSSLPSNLCRHFSFAEIKDATNNFDDALVLGVGGFGKVYRGEVDGGMLKVAIKRGNPLSDQGVHEFQTEIEMLSKLRHCHLVSLIGYCEENCEMILVYDYMAYGTLREHLYKTQKPPLPWKQRLEICIGAARGLHYLHTGAKHTIIHRDVKTTNILLDEKWVAKVSDFGLSKTGPTLDHTHVSTVVKGSFGYLDPEYFRRQQLTDKSDVYSFGVVLFEIFCARPALNPTLPKEQVSLAEWAAHCYNKGILDQLVDPYLNGKIAPECFKKFAETAMKCVADQGIERPSMGDVLWSLEFALQLQESAEQSGQAMGCAKEEEEAFNVWSSCTGKKEPDAFDSDSRSTGMSMSIGGRRLTSEDFDGLTPSAVFSQIMNPKGR